MGLKFDAKSFGATVAISAIKGIFKNAPATIYDEDKNEVMLGPVTSEQLGMSAKITTHAVEGKNISDHVHPEQDTFTIQTFLVDDDDLLAKIKNKALSFVGLAGAIKSVEDKIAQLKSWKDSGALLTYSGPVFSTFLAKGFDINKPDLAINRIDINRNADTGDGIDISIAFQEMLIAQAVLVDIRLPQAARAVSGKGVAEKGKEAGKSSLLAKIKKNFVTNE